MAASTLLVHPTQPSALPQAYPTSCPSCGTSFTERDHPTTSPNEAHRRILDLEAQVKLLNSKAAAAVDKLADYEDEVRSLRAAQARSHQQSLNSPTPDGYSRPPLIAQQSRLSSLSALLPGRRRDANPALPITPSTTTFPPSNLTPPQATYTTQNLSTPNLGGPSSPPDPPEPRAHSLTLTSLQTSLETEHSLRLRAEANLTQTQGELEELTAQLFGQANEMVATERKARAKLEERVKVLETRDVEKRRRLERLEKALERIERVRGMVG